MKLFGVRLRKNKSIEDKLPRNTYSIISKSRLNIKGSDLQGNFNPRTNKISIVKGHNSLTTRLHEKGHYIWKNRLSRAQKQYFVDKSYKAYLSIPQSKHATKKNYCCRYNSNHNTTLADEYFAEAYVSYKIRKKDKYINADFVKDILGGKH